MKFNLIESIGVGYNRAELIKAIKDLGYNYNFDKYTDQQLFKILNWAEDRQIIQNNDIPETDLYDQCDWCKNHYNVNDLFETDQGYLCSDCIRQIKKAGNPLQVYEEFFTEAQKDKKKKGAFGWFSTLNPGEKQKSPILPDKTAGIETFNKNMTYNKDFNSSSDSASSAGSADGGVAGGGE